MKSKQLNYPKKVDAGLPTKSTTNQTRKLGMVKQSSDFDRIDRENPFVGMASNPCSYSKGKK